VDCPCPPTGSDHFLTQLFVGALLVVAGWAVVHWQARKRDVDKERRSLLSASSAGLIENVNAILILARRYHTTARNLDAEQSIKMQLQDTAESIAAVRKIVRANDGTGAIAQSAIKRLRIAITGKHFEDEHDQPLSEGDRILELIGAEALNAKRALMQLQYAQYRQFSR
jgi:hypothetical protein